MTKVNTSGWAGPTAPRHQVEMNEQVSSPESTREGRRRFRPMALLPLGLIVVLSSCINNNQDSLDPHSKPARDIDRITNVTGVVAIIVGLAVFTAVILVILKFRAKRGHEHDLPNQLHGNLRLEIGWTILPTVLMIGLAVISLPVIFTIGKKEANSIEVKVEGQQWWWQYSYDLDGDGTYEIVTANDFVIPVGQNVNLTITSNDVIHSFWVPELNGKRDAVPGRLHDWKISADEPGIYLGQCAEFCGLSHADMRIRTIALNPDDWNAWVESQMQAAPVPPEAAEGQDPSLARKGYELFGQFCSSCHIVDGSYEAARENRPPLQSGVAPNLTHLMTRTSFAGALFDLYDQNGNLNEADLRAWIQDAPGVKPLRPDNQQGMISFANTLGSEDLDAIVAYLETLGSRPTLP